MARSHIVQVVPVLLGHGITRCLSASENRKIAEVRKIHGRIVLNGAIFLSPGREAARAPVGIMGG